MRSTSKDRADSESQAKDVLTLNLLQEARQSKVTDEPSLKVTPSKVTQTKVPRKVPLMVPRGTMVAEMAVNLRSGIIDMHRNGF